MAEKRYWEYNIKTPARQRNNNDEIHMIILLCVSIFQGIHSLKNGSSYYDNKLSSSQLLNVPMRFPVDKGWYLTIGTKNKIILDGLQKMTTIKEIGL